MRIIEALRDHPFRGAGYSRARLPLRLQYLRTTVRAFARLVTRSRHQSLGPSFIEKASIDEFGLPCP